MLREIRENSLSKIHFITSQSSPKSGNVSPFFIEADNRQIIVFEGLSAKFSQNNELKEKLISTGNSVLAECAVKDRIWGIGLSMTDPDRHDMSKWKGQNLLGYALMLVRERL